MAIELPSKTVQIDEFTYTIHTLDAVEARSIWVPLFKVLGGAVEASAAIEGDDEKKGAAVLGKMIADLPESLIDRMVDLYGNSSYVDLGKESPKVKQVYRMHFAGRPAHHVKWLVECTKVNFRDFLDGSSGLSLSSLAAAMSK